MQTIAFYLLFTLCLGVVDSRPATMRLPDPDGGPASLQEVYPIALRYRQQIDEKLHLLLLHPSGSCPPIREECETEAQIVVRAAVVSPATTLSHLLVGMQC